MTFDPEITLLSPLASLAFATALEVAGAAGLGAEFTARAEVAVPALLVAGVTPAAALSLVASRLAGAIGALALWSAPVLGARPF